MFRKLRIGVTAFCIAACGLLIVLWIHSYYSPFVTRNFGRPLIIVSWKGTLEVNPTLIMTGSRIQRDAILTIPYLSVVLILLTFAGLPWVRWSKNYGVRALLVMMTLLAVLFGVLANAN
jgi:hypothetical protein